MAWLRESVHAVSQLAVGATWASVCMAKGELPVEPGLLLTVGAAGLIAVAAEGLKKFGLDSRNTVDGIRERTLRSVETSYGTLAEQLDLKAADRALAESLKDCFLDRDALVQAALDPNGFPVRATDLVCAALAKTRPDVFGDGAPQAGRDFARAVVGAALDAAVTTPEYFEKLQPKLGLLALQSLARLLENNGRIEEKLDTVKEDTVAIRLMMEQVIASGAFERAEAAGLNEKQVRNLLIAFEQENIDPAQAERLLLKAAEELKDLKLRLSRLSNDEPEITAKRDAAHAAIEKGEFERADLLLSEAENADLEAGERRIKRAAETMAERAALARAQARFLDAASHYGRAAGAVASIDPENAWRWWLLQADVLDDYGKVFPGLASIADAITILRDKCLPLTTKDSRPSDWAIVQNNLGIALSTLGARAGGEKGLAALNEGVSAFRLALEVYSRKDTPADWAMTQNNLGVALQTLGERRDGGTDLTALNEAVEAFRAALEVYTRNDMPTEWAMTQNNLGIVLQTLGARASGEEGLSALNEAVAAFREALEVRTREDMPAQWAMTQNNLGNTLMLGAYASREQGLTPLKEAVTAYRAALAVRIHSDMPVQWAMTQNNLGVALQALGERAGGEEGLAALNEAVAAYRAALEVRTKEHMPYDWAQTQRNLEIALETLKEMREAPPAP